MLSQQDPLRLSIEVASGTAVLRVEAVAQGMMIVLVLEIRVLAAR